VLVTTVPLVTGAGAADDATVVLMAADGEADDEGDPGGDESVTFVVEPPATETATETVEETELAEDEERTVLEDKSDSDETKRDVEESDVLGTAGADDVDDVFTV